MRTLRAFFARLAGVVGRKRMERDLACEMACHLEMQIEENLRAGMSPEDARRDALIRCGGLEQAMEACRDRRTLPWIDTSIRELRHTVRLLRRSPVFTVVTVLSLALGIGANTAIFTLVDRLMLRLLPVRDPDRLVMIWTSGPNLGSNQGSRATSYPMYQDFQQRAQAFSHVFCRYLSPLAISADGAAERVIGELVSGNYFQALGVKPAIGRVFSPEQDDRVYMGHPVVVLSHQYWVSRFNADPGVLGRKILVNNYPMIVVGVSAAGFTGLDPSRSPQVRVPIQMKPLMTPASDNMGHRRRQWVQVFARMKPGYTKASARESLQPLLTSILRDELAAPAFRTTSQLLRERFLARKILMDSAATGYSETRRRCGTALVVLMSMVGLVLLIACFNVASLLVARAGSRQREIAVRLAIGASRGQLIRQLLIESAVLAAAGSALGLLFSGVLLRVLLGFMPSDGMLLALSATPDWRILGFNLALTMLTAFLFGLAPAWRGVRVDLISALKDGAGNATGSHGSVNMRRCLVTAQVAFSFLLLAGAGLFMKTLNNLRLTPGGYRDMQNLISFQLDPARSGYSLPRLNAFYRQLLDQVRALPGVKSAGFSWIPVLHGRECDWVVVVEGHPLRDDEDQQAYVNGVSAGYWQAMGIPLLEGRDFDSRDNVNRQAAAIVNREFASHYFPGRSPIGRHMSFDDRPGATLNIEIVGLAENSLYEGPRQGVRRQVFFPFQQLDQPLGAAFYVRTESDSPAAFAMLRAKVHDLDPTLPVHEMRTLENQLDENLMVERLAATLSIAFGLLATALAAIGLYGVLALAVTRRTKEIGLRMALGAPRGAVIWMVMSEALALLAVGIALGIPSAWTLNRFAASLLFGVAPADAGVAMFAALTLGIVAAAAGAFPARRATSVDPIQALRHQ